MPFEIERISDVDKSKIDANALKHPISGGVAAVFQWVIDRGRDAFLIAIGGGSADFPGRQYFVMGWKGELIRMELECKFTGIVSTGFDYTWRIIRLVVPPSLDAERQLIIAALKEALDAYGDSYMRTQIRSVQFEF